MVWGLNNASNKLTGKTPSELLLRYRPRSAAEAKILYSIGESTCDNDREKTRENAASVIQCNQKEQEARYNRKRGLQKQYGSDEVVVTKRAISSNEGSRKNCCRSTLDRIRSPRYTIVSDAVSWTSWARHAAGSRCRMDPGGRLQPWSLGVSDIDSAGGEDELGMPRSSSTHLRKRYDPLGHG